MGKGFEENGDAGNGHEIFGRLRDSQFFFAEIARIQKDYASLFQAKPTDAKIERQSKEAGYTGWGAIIHDLAKCDVTNYDTVCNMDIGTIFAFMDIQKHKTKFDKIMTREAENESKRKRKRK